MAPLIYLDTHVVAWLYTGDLGLFPAGVRRWLEEEELLISPMVELELQYLHEVGRTTVPGAEVVAALAAEIGLSRCDLPFEQVIAEAIRTSWTRDPFDRIIVAQAALRRRPLLTKDDSIREHYGEAVWVD